MILLKAFKDSCKNPLLESWILVFIGNGPEHQKLIDEAAELKIIAYIFSHLKPSPNFILSIEMLRR